MEGKVMEECEVKKGRENSKGYAGKSKGFTGTKGYCDSFSRKKRNEGTKLSKKWSNEERRGCNVRPASTLIP